MVEQIPTTNAVNNLVEILFDINNGWKPNWSDPNQRKYFIQYSHDLNKLDIGVAITWKCMHECLYVHSREAAQFLIDNHSSLLLEIFTDKWVI
jgi:hypothetical protein